MDRKVILVLIVTAMFLMIPSSAIDATIPNDASDASVYDDIPSSFEIRDVYGATAVRDQENTGLCAAFSEAAALEYLVAKNGGELEWLSPYYLGYHQFDGFGREWSGDRNEVISTKDGPFYMAGNNVGFSFTRLLSWITTVPESVLPPYTSEEFGSYAFDDPELEKYMVRLTGVKIMSVHDQTDDVKRMIMSGYGGAIRINAVYSEMLSIDGTLTCNSAAESMLNHYVIIVGWDDNYPKENFLYEPESDGAWLVKNSWGSDDNDDGYLWLSYESHADDLVVFYDSLARESEDVLYDNCNGGYGYPLDDYYGGLEFSNVFTATGDQMLTSVGLTSRSEDTVNYSIRIYTSLSDPSDPTSGIPAFPEPQTGTIDFDGAHYVNLDTPVHLDDGEVFSIVVKYEVEGVVGVMLNTYFDTSFCTNYVLPSPGKSFIFEDGEWSDIGAEGIFFQLRAYAETIGNEEGDTQIVPMMIIILLVAVTAAFVVRME